MILVPLRELGQGAGHGQLQRLDVANFLPEVLVWRQSGFLVGINLVEGNGRVFNQVEVHVPR